MSDYNLPEVRGKYRFDFPLANSTWFQVGGPADIFFKPEDEKDLAYFIKNKPDNLPYIVLGVCSNLIIRDGGYRGCVIKLGRNFSNITADKNFITAGASALDVNVAKVAAEKNLSGLEFLVGVPGTIGGAVAMNAGAYNREIKDCLISAKAIDGKGYIMEFKNSDFSFEYRKNNLPKDLIFTEATFECTQDDRKDDILNRMNKISSSREKAQPIRSKTGGSTFKNPDGYKAWELIDKAGCRGLKIGGAQVSEKHCNFLINTGTATAQDLENLGNEVKARVKANSGIELQWEIKKIGEK